jgi:hypothetical protein
MKTNREYLHKIFPIALLLLLPFFLFHHHVLGDATWIGNPDRLNNFLKLLKHYVENQAQGQNHAWNNRELMGYDSYGLPFMYPNILMFLTGWIAQLLGLKFLYIIAGYVSISLLSLCGISAYLLFNTLTHHRTISLTSAICYQLSALSVLSMSQNDNTLSVLIAAPLITLLIRHSNKHNNQQTFTLMTLLMFFMINFMFLQTVSYVFIFSGSYVLYRCIKHNDTRLFWIFLAAFLIALLSNFPRLHTLLSGLLEYDRKLPPRLGIDVNNFEEIYKVNTHFMEILRWFDNAIFGRTPSESIRANQINISEGFLLYSSAFVPFLIIYTTIYYKGKFLNIWKSKKLDARFFFWAFVITLSLIFIKPFLYMLYWLYLKTSFFHSRAFLIALLSGTIIFAYGLLDLHERYIKNLRIIEKTIKNIYALIFSMIFITSIEFSSKQWESFSLILGFNFLKESLFRTSVSFILFVFFLFTITSKKNKNAESKYISFSCLCFVTAIQAFVFNYRQINHKDNFVLSSNFSVGDFYYADRHKFLLPDKEAIQVVQNTLETDQYRTILVCNPTQVDALCVGHVPEFWQLRIADGYYGFGLPKRLTMLSWEYSLRAITFLQLQDLPWDLFSFLNVKYAIEVTPALYENNFSDKKSLFSFLQNIQYKVNPYPVLPRAFFAEAIQPVSNAQAAREAIFKNNRISDVRKQSFVEADLPKKIYATEGDLHVSGTGNFLEITIKPSDKERFLVLNELYFPGWSAKANGKELPIYPTNIFARGILLPPFVDKVTFEYQTLSTGPQAWYFYLAGLFLWLIGAAFFRFSSKYRPK